MPVMLLICVACFQFVIGALGTFFKQIHKIPLAPQPLLVICARAVRVIAEDNHMIDLDLYGERKLAELLRQLCRIDGLVWIRVHYLYPDEMSQELIDVLANEPKIVKYLDIPIQHINDDILRRMNRRGNGEYVKELFTKLRREIPGLVLRTSLITGLPGEGEAEFAQLCDFLKEYKLERVGAFAFSPEEGTRAAEMEYPDTEFHICPRYAMLSVTFTVTTAYTPAYSALTVYSPVAEKVTRAVFLSMIVAAVGVTVNLTVRFDFSPPL